MRVERGRGDVLVAQQALQEEQIDAVLQKKRRAGVSQHMRRHMAADAGRSGECAQALAERLRRPPAASGVEQGRRVGDDYGAEPSSQFWIDQWDAALALALAANVEAAVSGVEVRGPQRHQFADAQADRK